MHRIPISGGTDGTTLQHFGDGLSTLLSRSIENLQVPYTASAGSQENLRRLTGEQASFAIVFAGDLFRSGSESLEASSALVVSHLFGVSGHLLTLRSSPVTKISDLAGKTVAVGQAGSAAANAARHYFEAVDLWGRFEAVFVPASQGASALLEGRVEALWLFDEVPSFTVIQFAGDTPLRALPLLDSASFVALANAHPYYTAITIPGGTYPGIDDPVASFQESALWVSSAEVPADIVTEALQTLYSEHGLSFMHTVSETARALDRDKGLIGVVTPLHPGAEQFWHGNVELHAGDD